MKMSYFSLLLFTCLDLCVVGGIRQAQLSSLLLHHPFITLWAGGLVRACLLLSLALTYPGGPLWLRSFEGLQSIGVLCLLSPVYISLLWVLGYPTLDQLWGWHSGQALLQSYAVTIVAWLYWSSYVPSFLTRRTSDKKAKDTTGSSLKRLLGFLWPFHWQLIVVLVVVGLSSRCEMAVPEYTGQLADWIANEDAPDAFTYAIQVMTLMTIASAVLECLGDLLYNVTMSRVHTSVQGLIFQAVIKQEIGFFDATQTGEVVSHITEDTNKMSEALSEQLSLVMWYFARLVFLLVFMVRQSLKLSLFTFMGLPIILVIPKLSGRLHQEISVKVQESLAKANQVATETFTCIKTVRSFANEDGETEKYRRRLEDSYAINKQEAVAYAGSLWTNSMSSLSLKVCILYYGGTLVTGGTVRSGDLVAFVLYELQFSSALEALMRCYPNVKKAIGASKTIFEYLDREPKLPKEGTLAPENLEGRIEFKNVTFAYRSDDTNVLEDVSLQMEPGKITALVGLNSSGMSTCVALLERFYQPKEGEILLDGHPLNSYQGQYLHDRIGVVSQKCVLFARSIRENIKYGFEHATDEEMYRAAKLASAHNFIVNELQNGYDTDAGEKGQQLSGGQKQRIAIARALIRRPKVLILDNATSELDLETQHQVLQAVLNDANSISVLLISHTISIVEKAHRIVVLNKGKVEEEGSHEELLEREGLYAGLVREQNTAFKRKGDKEVNAC